ncbi:MAG: DUF4390 domain-containing protein [Syntrophales bacterium]|nr:DUF4390 domain-containing protein [Syntrophales bacterium]
MPKREHLKIIIVFCFFLLLCYPLSSGGRDAKFADLLVTNNADNILVYARVIKCFTKTMESAILAGVPTTFTFLVDFYQERPYWPDKRLARRIVKNTIKYNNVKKIFHVSSTNSEETATFQTFDNAKTAMADLNGVAVIPLNALTNGKPYYLRVKAQLDTVRLPLHMEYLFFFVSLWDFETDWHMQRIKY